MFLLLSVRSILRSVGISTFSSRMLEGCRASQGLVPLPLSIRDIKLFYFKNLKYISHISCSHPGMLFLKCMFRIIKAEVTIVKLFLQRGYV